MVSWFPCFCCEQMCKGHVCILAQTTTMPSGSVRHILQVFVFRCGCGRLTNIITAALTIAILSPPFLAQAAAMGMTMSMCIAMTISLIVAAAMSVIATEVALVKFVVAAAATATRAKSGADMN